MAFSTQATRRDWGLTVLRVVTGTVFFMHGWQKFFDMGVGNVAGFFGSLGIPLPGLAAPLVAALELAGGAMLAVGLFTTLVAALLAIDMLVAMLLVHLPNGFFVSEGGVEFTLLLLAAAVASALAGPGRPSVDAMLAGRRGKGAAKERTASTGVG